MGRPKIPLSPKEVESIESMSGYGMSMEQIAQVLRMSKATLQRRLNDTPPELGAKNALERGRAIAITNITKTAFDMARSGKESGMTQFWLQCRAGWVKKEGIELTGKNGAPLQSGPPPQVTIVLPDNGRDKK